MNNVAVALSNVGKTYNNVTVVDNSLLIEERINIWLKYVGLSDRHNFFIKTLSN